ncbi:MAG TPA: hypothetical protein VHN14_18750 [Kofleriaceae bacterium]|nr:hypothetical protein [Kofleriaceae bacterium]
MIDTGAAATSIEPAILRELGYYSERLHPILSAAGKIDRARLHVASASLGQGNHPMLFTDALVRSPRCEGACADAARRFAAYYVSVPGAESCDPGRRAVPQLGHPRGA